MEHALNPNESSGRPPRLIRYVRAGLEDLRIWTLDQEDNLLVINLDQYELLDDVQRHQVLRTQAAEGEVVTQEAAA